jgi:hypothetical protein
MVSLYQAFALRHQRFGAGAGDDRPEVHIESFVCSGSKWLDGILASSAKTFAVNKTMRGAIL